MCLQLGVGYGEVTKESINQLSQAWQAQAKRYSGSDNR